MESTVAVDDRFVAAEHLVDQLLACGLPTPYRVNSFLGDDNTTPSVHLHFHALDEMGTWARRLSADAETRVLFGNTARLGSRRHQALARVGDCRVFVHGPSEHIDSAAIAAEVAGPRLPVAGVSW